MIKGKGHTEGKQEKNAYSLLPTYQQVMPSHFLGSRASVHSDWFRRQHLNKKYSPLLHLSTLL